QMDLVTHKVSRWDQGLELTAKEFELLEYLMRHSGSVVSREMLARDVWHATARATPLDNVIDVTIARLRRKIDEPYEKKLLHTVRGVGFILGGSQGGRPSVRARLTLWHAGVLTLIVCVFSASILLFVKTRLYAGLDAQLGREIATI